MRLAGRVSAAIEVLADLEIRKRPAALALKDWGLSHRFAGSGDRAIIGNLVFDSLRQQASLAFAMESQDPRALVLRVLTTSWGLSPDELEALCDGSRFAPEALSDDEREGLKRTLPEDAPAPIRGDYPGWLEASFTNVFGEDAALQGASLACRAPIDLRVNTLKADRAKVLKALARFEAGPTQYAPLGVRVAASHGAARSPHLEAEAGHGKGWFEVQDEGSQIASLMSGAAPRGQVLDLCAGAGGKTLALAAQMDNTGQLYAYDADRTRLRPIFERLKRAGARNVQVLRGGDRAALDGLKGRSLDGRLDLVVIDAPCTGSGTWRRHPDAKWRLTRKMLETRTAEQAAVLEEGAPLVAPGGRLHYITCSVLPEENRDQITAFLERHKDFALKPWREGWDAMGRKMNPETNGALPSSALAPRSADGSEETLLMTPKSHGTDGFFIAALEKKA